MAVMDVDPVCILHTFFTYDSFTYNIYLQKYIHTFKHTDTNTRIHRDTAFAFDDGIEV